MKRYLFFVILFLVSGHNIVFCQNQDFYCGKTIVEGENFVYKVVEHRTFIALFDTTNVMSQSKWFLRDGITYGDSRMAGYIEPEDITAVYNMFKSLFTSNEISIIKQGAEGRFCAIDAVLVVDENGKVLEVDYNFPKIPVLTSISPSVFYELSEMIKESLTMKYPDYIKKQCSYVKGVSCYIDLRKL
ncbi:MAG: hypothetical protein IJN06_00435 [Bacteroidales bacterium]|nr:hypothetical protein [Bacteroidales bacterium]MBQ7017457.1 hypothetical protein [Bacteroidales bacterium]MBR2477994.1 hypothetical protein [Bacteroidales bacterium]